MNRLDFLAAIHSLRPRSRLLQIIAAIYTVIGALSIALAALQGGPVPAILIAVWVINGGLMATLAYSEGRDDMAAEVDGHVHDILTRTPTIR